MSHAPVHALPAVPGLRIAIAGFLALAAAMGIGRFALTPLLPMMQAEGLSIVAGGWLASANYAGYLLGALAAMAVRVEVATAVRGGLIAIGLSTLAMGATSDPVVWALSRLLAGMASAGVLIHATASCLERLSPLRRPVTGGVVFAGVGCGILASGAVSLAAMHAGWSPARTWIALGSLSLGICCLVWNEWGTAGGGEGSDPAAHGAWGTAGNNESVRLIFAYGVFGFGYIIPATFLPVMARQVFHGSAHFGWAWPVLGAAAAASTVAVAALATPATNRRLWICSQFVLALGVLLPVFHASIAGIMMAAVAVGATFMVITMAAIQTARDIAGTRPTRLIAAMTAAFALGQIAGPIVAGHAVDAWGDFAPALLLAGGLSMTGSMALMRRRPLMR